MTPKEFKKIMEQLDKAKFDLLRQGIAFDLTAYVKKKKRECFHTGIGTGADMSLLTIISAAELFKTANGRAEDIEPFCNSLAEKTKEWILATIGDDMEPIS